MPVGHDLVAAAKTSATPDGVIIGALALEFRQFIRADAKGEVTGTIRQMPQGAVAPGLID